MNNCTVHRHNAGLMRGFTVIELLVVLVILGLITGIAAPAVFDANDRARLDSAAIRLVDDMRRARAMAVTQGAPVTLDTQHLLADDAVLLTGARPLTFYPDGSASMAQMTLTLGAQRRSLSIDWLTGRAAYAE